MVLSHTSNNNKECSCSPETLYENHSAVMYGICLKLSGSEKTANEIFQQAFGEINAKFLMGEMGDKQDSIQLCVIKHTYRVAINYLKITDVKAALKRIFHPVQMTY